MTSLTRIALLFLACCIALPLSAAELTPHKAEYKVSVSIIGGRLNTELRETENGFVATHVIKPTGLGRLVGGRMRVTSAFASSEDGLLPIHYHAIDSITDDPEARIAFDWSSNVASGTVGGSPVEFQLEGLSFDAVSLQYELMHNLLNGEPDTTYTIFDVDKMRVINVRNAGKRSVKTPAGTYDVVGIQHQREGSKRITTMWCAPELGYLPVIIERHRKGKLLFRATLRKYTPT